MLKDGSTTEDRRLGHIPEFDAESLDYPVRPLTSGRPPKTRMWPCAPRLDQLNESACVGFAWAHKLAAEPVVNVVNARLAREKIYWEAQKIDQWPGGAYPGAHPRMEGTSVLAGAKAVQAIGGINEYRWAFSLDDVLRAVSEIGPEVVGWRWYSGMFDADREGIIRRTGNARGGHAVCVRGVDMERSMLRIRNSWGPRWGQRGDCWLPFEDAEKLINEGGEQCVPVHRERMAVEEPTAKPVPWWQFWRRLAPAAACVALSSCTVMTHNPDRGGVFFTTANADRLVVDLSEGTLRANDLSHESIEAALRSGIISVGQAMLLKGLVGPVDDAVGVVGSAVQ